MYQRFYVKAKRDVDLKRWKKNKGKASNRGLKSGVSELNERLNKLLKHS